MDEDNQEITGVRTLVRTWMRELNIQEKENKERFILQQNHCKWLRKIVYIEKTLSIVMIVLLAIIAWNTL